MLNAMLRNALMIATLLCPAVAAAQGEGGVANSGMGQGEARISARSDIRLSMESMPGTSGASVSALGTRVGQRMTQLRTCYEETLSEDPTVRGTMRLRVLLDSDGAPNVEVDRDDTESRDLQRCITRTLRSIDTSRLRRPTRAIVQLEMANSAAEGAERAAVRAQEARQVSVEIDGDGNAVSRGGTPDGRVRFTVTGEGRESAGAVVAAHRALLTVLPGLLDCRRRAGRRGRSSGGEARATMRVRDGRPPAARVTRCTLGEGNERLARRSRGCLNRALRGIAQRSRGGTGAVTVDMTFSEAEDVENARD